MHIVLSTVPPTTATVLALPIEKDALERSAIGGLDAAAKQVVLGAAKGGRFDGRGGGRGRGVREFGRNRAARAAARRRRR